MARHYTPEETEEILRRAAANAEEGLSHEDLVAAAEEVGIERSAVEAAVLELEERGDTAVLERRVQRRRRSRLARSVATYAIVNGFLATVDLWTGGDTWVHWSLLGWGLLLLFQARRALLPSEDEMERDLAREERRLVRERERKRRRAVREKRRASQREFEQAVEAGVTALVNAIQKHVSPPSPARPQSQPGRARARVVTPRDAPDEAPAESRARGAQRRETEK